jgi:hypothetical protein
MSPESIEVLSSRLWRPYDQQAFELLADIRQDRQSKIALVVRKKDIRSVPPLIRTCLMLFGK